jgi:uncharacterized protein (DUF1501 family)
MKTRGFLSQFERDHRSCSRRAFAGYLAKSMLGVGVGAWTSNPLAQVIGDASRSQPASRSAKKVIYLYMNGGMSHLDTLDPKEDAAVRGATEIIKASRCHTRLSAYMPRLAECAHHTAIIRSMHSNQGAHERGRYFVWTGYAQRGTIRHPSLGSWAVRLGGSFNPNLPGYIKIGGDTRHPGGGFLDSTFAPLPIRNPDQGLQHSQLADGLDEATFNARLSLSREFNQAFEARFPQQQVRAYGAAYDHAIKLMKSRDLAAFDLTAEPDSMREAYGGDAFGKGCLLARRLIERDVRFVEVSLGGWDTNQDNFPRVEARAALLDQALSTLLQDLSSRGLLDETLVVLATEFGRTPKINQNNGRDHYPKAFSCLLAGGGVKGGSIVGSTDSRGAEVISDPVTIPDFNATIAYALGLPLDQIVTAPSGRPFTIADKGQPLKQLFS